MMIDNAVKKQATEEQEALVISPSSSISEEEEEDITILVPESTSTSSERQERVRRRCRQMCYDGIRGGGGCTFALLYILLSLLLMSTMFNMREIVGDYLLGSKEEQSFEYRQEIERAMDLRRRSPWIGHEMNDDEAEHGFALDLSTSPQYSNNNNNNQFLRRHMHNPRIRTEDHGDEEDEDFFVDGPKVP